MLTGLVIGTLIAIGGGSDAVEPEYVDSVDFDDRVKPRGTIDTHLRDLIESYENWFDLTWSDAYRWHLAQDNREYGLLDVKGCFDRIYEGVSYTDGDITVWVSSPAKSGGIIDLLEDYDIEAEVRLIPLDPDFDKAAFTFLSKYGSAEYYAAEVNEDESGLVVYTDSVEAADLGPELFGNFIDGVPVDYQHSE